MIKFSFLFLIKVQQEAPSRTLRADAGGRDGEAAYRRHRSRRGSTSSQKDLGESLVQRER